jgi:hypothetical protein
MTATDVSCPASPADLERSLTTGHESGTARARAAAVLMAATHWSRPRAAWALMHLARVLLWMLRECVTFGCDVVGLVNWLYRRIGTRAAVWLACLFVAAGIVGGYEIHENVPAHTLVGASVVVYASLAALTAVPRARHHVRRTLHHAIHSVAGRGDTARGHALVPKPRWVRWRFATRQLQRADLPVPLSWQHGRENNRDTLADEIGWRLAPYGLYRLSWPAGQPMARVRRTAPLPTRIDAQEWHPPAGVVLLGVTEPNHPTVVKIDKKIHFAVWSRKSNPHMLFAGETGNGKTAGLRWMTRAVRAAAAAAGQQAVLVGLDGKGGASLGYLRRREGVLGVGDEPAEWLDLIRRVDAEMKGRYALLRAWRNGEGPRPWFGTNWTVIVDELVDIYDQLSDQFMDPFGRIARLGREAGIHLIASVLRPDVAEAIPGLIRAQLNARLLLGALHDQQTATMMFGPHAKKAQRLSDEEDDAIQGRGIARLGGRMYRVQLPYVTDPADDRAGAEHWLPPKLATVTALPTARPDELPRRRADRRSQITTDHDVISLDNPARPQRRGTSGGPVDLTGSEV